VRIYNLFPLLAGPFDAWSPHIDRAAKMGFDWIFVNPIQRPGRSGSLYSIADYFALNPTLVDPTSKRSPDTQLREVNRMAERQGFRMMVDLVINHCAEDSTLVRRHPKWFAHEADGSVAHPYCVDNGRRVVWKDLARFDHQGTSDPEGLFRYCCRIVRYLIGLGFQAVRCDAAYQVPAEFWERLIEEVKREHPDTVFAAETLGCTADQTKATARAGFDYVFNSSKWWDFGSPWLLEQYHLVRESASSISFPESHDVERLFAEVDGNVDAMKQRYLFAGVFSTGVMMPIGYEFGFRKRLHVVDTRPEDWEEPGIDLRPFITEVNALKSRYRVFQEDCPTTVIGYDNPGVMVMWKASTTSNEEALIILNKETQRRQRFYADNLRNYVQAGAPLADVSPEHPVDYVPVPFEYELQPGEARVFVTTRD